MLLISRVFAMALMLRGDRFAKISAKAAAQKYQLFPKLSVVGFNG